MRVMISLNNPSLKPLNNKLCLVHEVCSKLLFHVIVFKRKAMILFCVANGDIYQLENVMYVLVVTSEVCRIVPKVQDC